ncbi:hypothetical protein Goshw_019170 [Gossypium schwendimanii]|uniref:Uncharacterized protein n=1 Tax=Gossypium schwendimanii TaxID=34291 RepID=A0A7J9L455_GOSSC|nr:hypothetical protein [Gossypium schwendimanii]
MLGVCTPDMHFVYVLPGWKGFVVDGWILRDAISRRHGLKVSHAIGKDAQTTIDIVDEIDAEDVAIAKSFEEGNNYRGCEDDVSLDEMDVSATQSQSSTPNQDSSTFSKKKKKKDLWWK